MGKRSEANLLAKECIVTAMIELMKTVPYDSITVTEIAKRAGVSRMAYYRNYASKEDILNKYMDEVGERVHEIVEDSGHRSDFYTYFYELFIKIGLHSDIGLAAVHANRGELILENIDKNMFLTFPPEKDSAEERYRRHFIAGAFYNVYIHWITTGKRESPEELAELCSRILRVSL